MPQINVACSNIIEKDGKFLFVTETKEITPAFPKGRFSLPAGKLEFGETILEGAMREALEETGLNVQPKKLVGIYQRPRSRVDTNTTVFVFHSQVTGGTPTPSYKHPQILYLTLDQVLELESRNGLTAKYIPHALRDYLAGQSYALETIRVIK